MSTDGNSFHPAHFCTNKISSTKYSIITFLPLSIFQQLKNVVTCFYLFNAFLQGIKSISTNSPLASLIPCLWIIFMGVIYELISDIRRYLQDKRVNDYPVGIVRVENGKANV